MLDAPHRSVLLLCGGERALPSSPGQHRCPVLGPDGTVRAYSCFIREAPPASTGAFVLGGARRRAYELLRSQLGTALIACLYRSQDGAIEYDRVTL